MNYIKEALKKMAEKKTGVVKFFDRKKGWGFITDDEDGKDIYVHYTALQMEGYKALYPDDKVSYVVSDYNGRICASNVSKL